MSAERRPASMGERWRRVTSTGVDFEELERALASMTSIGSPRIRIQPGSIQTELEGSMGALHEVSVHVPTLPNRIWPQVLRVMRRSHSMIEGLRAGLVPRSFDRLIARVSGEALFPDARRVTSACTCSEPERPCRHILALHELFARRLEEQPWQLLVMRGVQLRELLDQAARQPADAELPALPFGAREEPILLPEGESGDLDEALSNREIRSLLGAHQARTIGVVAKALERFRAAPRAED